MALAMATMIVATMISPSTVTRRHPHSSPNTIINSLRLPTTTRITQKVKSSDSQLYVKGSSSVATEQVVAGLTTAALIAAMVIPDIAEAAQPGISPSLKNFLLSIVSGGVVLGVIVGAVIGVANFDPVKRT